MSNDPKEFDSEDDQEPEYFVLSQGWFVDFLLRFPTPVLALPGRNLYRVLVHGHGFSEPVEDSEPIVGFYTTVIASAKDRLEAEQKAIMKVKDRWDTFHPDATGGLFVDIEETRLIEERFKLRSILGFSLYSEDDPPNPDSSVF